MRLGALLDKPVGAGHDPALDRDSCGIQVDVESRFLKVTDNFLEDIGVDFRGLGNSSSEGVPGRGLDGRNNIGFDDFGRRENSSLSRVGVAITSTSLRRS